MRIKSLIIPSYKNLNIDLDFKSDLITLLVGQNGMGKSNLIEILALIFKDLYILKDKKQFAIEATKSDSFDYIIEYECRGIDVKIEFVGGNISIATKLINSEEYQQISFSEFRRKADDLLPDRVMGYYSGENRRIEEMLSTYTSRERRAQRHSYKKKSDNNRMRKIFFSENKHSQLILFTLAVYRNHPIHGEAMKRIIQMTLGIDDFLSYELVFKNPSFAKLSKLIKSKATLEDYEGEILSVGDIDDFKHINIFWGIKGKINSLLYVFLRHNISSHLYSIYQEENREFFALRDDSYFDSDLLESIYATFPNPVDFFDALEATVNIGSLHLIKMSISKINNQELFEFEALSEGEQQLISVLGLMAVLKEDNEEVLYLIDEPDTHINPQWQRSFIKLLLDNIGNSQHRHMFISTHSPFLVQAYEDNVDILLFRKDDQNEKVIIDIADNTIKNWRIDQVLMSPYFDLESTRPSSIDEFMKKRLEIIKRGELTDEDKAELSHYENELGFLPTGETLTELDSMVYIHNAANRFKEEVGE